jgi:hypothetical protein
MSSLCVDPISPELVLVCPELREQALARLPVLPWEAAAARLPVRSRSDEAARPFTAWEIVVSFVALARLATVVLMASISVTLVLTLVADAIR